MSALPIALLDRLNCPVVGYEELWAKATEVARETEPTEPIDRREQARQIAAGIVALTSQYITDLVWDAFDQWEASLDETESLDLEEDDYDED